MPRRPTVVALLAATAATALTLTLAGCVPLPGILLNHLPDEPNGASTTSPCRSNSGTDPTSQIRQTPAPNAIPSPQVTPDPALAATERMAMPADQFWDLIAVLHGSNSDAAYRRLKIRLEQGPVSDLVPFEARMTLSLYELDDQCRAHWYAHHDPTGLGFVADDDFLYVRADTVSAGRATFDKAIRTDTLPWGTTDAVDRDGEDLLYVAGDAAAHDGIGDKAWYRMSDAVIPVSYETASNPNGWPASDLDG